MDVEGDSNCVEGTHRQTLHRASAAAGDPWCSFAHCFASASASDRLYMHIFWSPNEAYTCTYFGVQMRHVVAGVAPARRVQGLDERQSQQQRVRPLGHTRHEAECTRIGDMSELEDESMK